jgi:hypothetical protein
MKIGNIAGDPSYNFFKAVDAARQRNTTFSQIQPSEKTEAPQKARMSKQVASPSLFQAYGNKPAHGAVSSTTIAVTSPVKTRILGGFFDAYA